MPAVASTAVRWVADRRARHELAEGSATYYRRVLLRFARDIGPDRPIATLRRADIDGWLVGLNVSPATAKLYLNVVSVFCAWCCAAGYVRKDPAVDVDGPRLHRTVPRRVPPDGCQAVLDACADDREKLMVSLAYREALRVGEIARIEVGDIDWYARTMVVRGKGGHERVVPVTAATWAQIGRYLDGKPRTSGPLIRSCQRGMDHHGISPATVSRLVSAVMARASVNESGHALRHTAAIETLEQGAHIRQVQQLLGHDNVRTTSRYLGPVDAEGLRRYMDARNRKALV